MLRTNWFPAAVLVILIAWALTPNSRSQTAAPWQVGVGSALHTACTVTASTTTYCFANDGLWVSLNGAAYAQVATPAGVTSLTVCNVGGTSCGLPLSGAVTLNVPKTGTASAPTITLQ
jgi:hypothetical protein